MFVPPNGQERAFSFSKGAASVALLDMMRQLLADRFGLKVHRETREMEALIVSVAKRAPRWEAAADPSSPCLAGGGKDRTEWRNVTMANLAGILESRYRRPAVDRTGLDGAYDFRLKYDPKVREDAPIGDPSIDGAGISLRSALEAQLGLVIKDGKVPVEVLVIDAITRPTEN